MMDRRIEILLMGLALMAMLLYALIQVLGGFDFVSALKAGGVLAPALLVLFASMHSIWVGLGVGMMVLMVQIPVPLLDRLGANGIFAGLLLLFALAQVAMRKQGDVQFRGWAPRLILLAGAIVLFRFLYDRPGSARMGGSGGGGQAVLYLLSFFSFWAFAVVASSCKNFRLNYRALIWMGSVGFLLLMARLAPDFKSMVFAIFHRPGWLLAPAFLAYLFHRRARRTLRSDWVLYAAMAGILFVAVLTPHRSRPLFAAAMILGLSFSYGYARKTVLIMGLLGVLALGSILTFASDLVPYNVRRSLSIVLPVDEQAFRITAMEQGISYETGWTSGFRASMYRIGLKKIRENPLAGAGFSFELTELLEEFYAVGGDFRDFLGGLALAGGYHNSIFALAVFCGLPAAIAFGVGYLWIGWRFLMFTRRQEAPSEQKLFNATVLGFFISSSGQMLMNGHAGDLLIVSSLLGIMFGVMHRHIRPRSVASPRSATRLPSSRHAAVPRPQPARAAL